MTDKIELIKAEIERRKSLADKQINNLYFLARSDAYAELLNFINSLEEEPVSEDLEEAAIIYLKENWDVDNVYEEDDLGIRNAFKAGAQWQKLKTKKEVIDNAVEWIVIENKNGGCVYDGWEEDFRKALREED